MEFEWINSKYNTEFTNRLLANKHIFNEIYEASGNKFAVGCGSYLFDGQSYVYCNLMYEKQELLYNTVKDVQSVLEIGTYMGHSALIMLMSNPTLKITCVDISNEYTQPAVNVLNKYFNDRVKFIHSDSVTALGKLNEKFDFFHIDSDHLNNLTTTEFIMTKSLNSRSDRLLRILFDDQECMIPLQNVINLHYNVTKKIIPNCTWNNVYYELQL
jgi:spermidine synthase